MPDEERLVSATLFSTMGLRNRAILRIMARTGGRMCDIRDIDIDFTFKRYWITKVIEPS